jgi:hypothetical protein
VNDPATKEANTTSKPYYWHKAPQQELNTSHTRNPEIQLSHNFGVSGLQRFIQVHCSEELSNIRLKVYCQVSAHIDQLCECEDFYSFSSSAWILGYLALFSGHSTLSTCLLTIGRIGKDVLSVNAVHLKPTKVTFDQGC